VELPQTLAAVEEAFLQAVPDHPWELRFLDEEVQQQYETEQRWSTTVTAASGLAMVIAALGLLGMATMEVAQRTKEIGIRKALGASATRIVLLLARPVTLLVLLASALVTPAVLLLMGRWLESFAYRIELGPVPLVAATLAALALAWVTVGLLAWRAARANPVRALRYE
jgi:putative ABC transport system permease protein